MNLTIPIRAQNSSSSLSRGVGGNSSRIYLWRRQKSTHTRLVLSLVAAGLLVGALVTGSVGSVMYSASAQNRDDTSISQQGEYLSDDNEDKQELLQQELPVVVDGATARPSNIPVVTEAPAPATPSTPIKNQTSTPVQTQSPALTPAIAPAVIPAVIPQPVVTPTPVTAAKSAPTTPTPTLTPTPVALPAVTTPAVVALQQPQVATVVRPEVGLVSDTNPAIAAMVTTQADTRSQPVIYTNGRMSDQTRNQLIALAALAALVGGLLYTLSFIGGGTLRPTRSIPIRYIVPIREVSQS